MGLTTKEMFANLCREHLHPPIPIHSAPCSPDYHTRWKVYYLERRNKQNPSLGHQFRAWEYVLYLYTST